MFLKLDGITGESHDAFHKGEIDVLSFSWGASASTAIGSGQATGLGSRHSHSLSLNFTKISDSASPQLFDKWCGGNVIKEAVFTARHPSPQTITDTTNAAGIAGSPEYFLKLTLTEVLVSSFMQGGHAQTDSSPMEQVSLNFAKIVIDAVAPDGNVVEASCSEFLK
jgi:type VI secretion system secreted protein Hcp